MHIKDAISSDDELKPVNGAPTTVVTVPGLRSLLPMNFEWIFQRLCTEYKVSGSARVPIINGIYTKKTGPEEEQHAVYFQTSFNATVKADVAGVDKVTVDTAHEGIKAGMVVTGDGVEAGAPKADGAAASPPPVKVVSIADSVVTLSVAQKALKAGTVLSFAIDPSNTDHTEKPHVLCWDKSGWVITEDYDILHHDDKVLWHSVRAHEPEETSTLGGQGPQNAVDTTWTSKPASELKPHTTWLSKPGGYFGLKPEDKPWPGETSLTVEGVPLA